MSGTDTWMSRAAADADSLAGVTSALLAVGEALRKVDGSLQQLLEVLKEED